MDDDSEIEIRFFNRNYFCLARAQSVGGAVQDPPRGRAWMLSQRTPVDFRGAAVKKPPGLGSPAKRNFPHARLFQPMSGTRLNICALGVRRGPGRVGDLARPLPSSRLLR
jgi:hypothetical protein